MAVSHTNCLVAQSGGPTTAINSSLSGVIAACRESGRVPEIYGAANGIQGVLDGRILDLNALLPDEGSLARLRACPSMYLGSCRLKLPEPELGISLYERIFQGLGQYGIGYFFYIGGNDSMDTARKLAAYGQLAGSPIRFLGIPKTIDNDLPATDHTPGYGSAARFVATSMLEMAHDTYIYNTQSVLIAEVMGRDAGWLTAAAALARNSYSSAPHLLYLPERDFTDGQFLADLRQELTRRNHVVVAVSEGIHYADGRYVSASSESVDQFGHAMLSGAGKYLEHLVSREIGCKVRSVELNVLQRCAAHLSSATDLAESCRLGRKAVEGALAGVTGKLPVLRRVGNEPYQVEYGFADLALAAGQTRRVPQEWINEAGNDVTDEFLAYARPLIQGTPDIPYENGLPSYLPVGHLETVPG